MHWGRVNGYEQARVFEQCRQDQQIELAGKIEYSRLQFSPNGGEVCALKITCATGQNGKKTQLGSGEFDYLAPTFRLPKFFRPRRTRMENCEWSIANLIAHDSGGALFR
ncbi:MAG TPA: hypothetical protein VJ278_00450, partial [Chthoniobacterales bacterium]|nr:hypothetical protein [Chthoniobacterales bacterium]